MSDQPTSTGPAASAEAAAAVVRPSARRVDVTGEDRLNYLEDVTTQAFRDATAGDVRGALYLDPHGAPLAMFDAAVLADRVALLAPDDEVASTLVDVLGARTFLADATFTLTDDVVVSLVGDGCEEVAQAANLTTRPGTVRPAGGDVFVIGRSDDRLDVVGPRAAVDELEGLLRDAGAAAGSADDLDTWRIRHGVPAWGVEVVAPHLPEEVGLLPTHVHLAKGCYPGQEAVARMWMLGRPRRRLAVVAPAGDGVDAGWETGSGRHRATVTSVARDRTLALAFVPADAEPGAVYGDDGGASIEVVGLVGAGAEVPGHDPSVPRRRDRKAG